MNDKVNKYLLHEIREIEALTPTQLQIFSDEAISLKKVAQEFDSLVDYKDSWIIDLTEFTPEVAQKEPFSWAGSPNNRACNDRKKQSSLAVRRLFTPEENDMNYSKLKSWVPHLGMIEKMRLFGDLRKITLSCLKPGGWWPSHYDFSCSNGYKLNMILSTNSDAKTLVWNQKKKKMTCQNLPEGGIYFINVGMKHTAHNWGHTPRIHLLGSYARLNLEVLDEIKIKSV
jgi:hypothetical protein